MSLHGKVGFVTGGAQGLGKGFAEALLKRGAQVCIADVKVQTGEATVSYFRQKYGLDRAIFVKCDVTNEADVKAAFERVISRYGHLDIVVNNAGISDEDNWDKMVDINVKGVILGMKYGMQAMSKTIGGKGGTIINIASTAGLLPVFNIPVYTATKQAVVGLTRSWAENPESQVMGLKFGCLCPSFANTNILKKEIKQHQLKAKAIADKMMEHVGIMEVSQVVAAFEELLDQTNNGVVLAVTKKKGMKIVHKGSKL